MDDDETTIDKNPLPEREPERERCTAELRIPLTVAERNLFEVAAGGRAIAWARSVLLAAAEKAVTPKRH